MSPIYQTFKARFPAIVLHTHFASIPNQMMPSVIVIPRTWDNVAGEKAQSLGFRLYVFRRRVVSSKADLGRQNVYRSSTSIEALGH